MGQYNPHAPYILGQEWVPIRNAHYQSDGVTERGYVFTLDAVTTPVSGAFYVNEYPPNAVAQACDFISVYPSGRETLTGPVKSLKIRPSAVTVTNPGSIDITSGVAALYTPEDPDVIIFDADTGILSQLQVSFDTDATAALLLGKRIVDVRLLYSMRSFNIANSDRMTFRIHNQLAFKGVIFPEATEITWPVTKISTLSLTELNATWDANVGWRNQRTVLPWRFQELNRFRAGASAAEALTIFMQNEATEFPVLLDYLEMEVLYCEETRVLYGGFRTYDSNFNSIGLTAASLNFYNIGAIAAQLYSPTTFTPGAALPAGEYVVTIYHRDMASKSIYQGTPKIHAVREYYQLPHQRVRWIRQSMTPGESFSLVEPDDVLTQITLHTATQIVTGVHPYGTSFGAPVYGSVNATQSIEDNPAAGMYTQARYYARRYGNTTVPLTLATTGGANTVSISVADFDALEEIVDGWREVNLTFPAPVAITPTAGTSDWRWSSPNELAGNQWQVMVASGPSGAWGPNANAAATGPATYWAPLGSSDALVWQSPSVSGVANDTTSDAVLIFSQDPPAVTGFALTIASQPLTVALQCSSPPRCVPTGLGYINATWTYGAVACDSFNRVTTSGLGTPNFGPTWTVIEGPDTDVFVDDDVAWLRLSGPGTARSAELPVSVMDVDIVVENIAWPVIPTASSPGTANPAQFLRARFANSLNFVEAQLFRLDTNVMSMRLASTLAGVETAAPGGFVIVPGATSTSTVSIRLQAIGSTLRMKVWLSDQIQPNAWSLSMTATTLAPGSIRIRADVGANSTITFPVAATFGSLTALKDPKYDGTYVEVQRRDTVDNEWMTVALSSGPCVSAFTDYEARVGVLSEYRIRTLNALDFAGPWVTGSVTLPAPGVAGAGDANSVLIFTSNEQPDANLAYVMQFDGQPAETFSFPEADTVTLQRLFGRDFFMAIRPLERGGERFIRTILVNHAAITLPSLANFRGLRDLAWDDLDYVCVRDELGNRWFATVIVPDGVVRGDRTIYLAQIEVIEVTDTASPTTLP